MSEFPRTLRRAMLCYCGEDLSRDSQKHKNYGVRHTGQCIKGRKCPLQELGHGRWHVALAALNRMDPSDRGERYPHLQLREIEPLVSERNRKWRDQRTSERITQQSAMPTTTSHPSHNAVHRKLYSIPGLWLQRGLNPHTVPAAVRHLLRRDPKELWFLHPIPTPRSTSTKGSLRRERMRTGSSEAAQMKLAKAAAAAKQQQGRPGRPARPPQGSSKAAQIAAAALKSCCTSLQT